MQNAKCKMQNAKCKKQNAKCKMSFQTSGQLNISLFKIYFTRNECFRISKSKTCAESPKSFKNSA